MAGQLVPIRVQYYQGVGPAMIAFYWKKPTGGATYEIVGSEALYHKTYTTAVTGRTWILSAEYTPQMATGLI